MPVSANIPVTCNVLRYASSMCICRRERIRVEECVLRRMYLHNLLVVSLCRVVLANI